MPYNAAVVLVHVRQAGSFLIVANSRTGAAQSAVKKKMQNKTSAQRLQDVVTLHTHVKMSCASAHHSTDSCGEPELNGWPASAVPSGCILESMAQMVLVCRRLKCVS